MRSRTIEEAFQKKAAPLAVQQLKCRNGGQQGGGGPVGRSIFSRLQVGTETQEVFYLAPRSLYVPLAPGLRPELFPCLSLNEHSSTSSMTLLQLLAVASLENRLKVAAHLSIFPPAADIPFRR